MPPPAPKLDGVARQNLLRLCEGGRGAAPKSGQVIARAPEAATANVLKQNAEFLGACAAASGVGKGVIGETALASAPEPTRLVTPRQLDPVLLGKAEDLEV